MGKGKDKLKSSALRSAWMEISLANILHNVKEIQKIAGKSKIIAMVKADAYGHGATEISTFLADNGIDYFAIATLKEGIELRRAGLNKNIILLSPVDNYYADIIVENDFMPIVTSLDNAKALHLHTGIGVPQYLEREIAQSFTFSSQFSNLLSPTKSGCHFTVLLLLTSSSLSFVISIYQLGFA